MRFCGFFRAQSGLRRKIFARKPTIGLPAAASAGLTMRQCARAFRAGPEQEAARRWPRLHQFKTTVRIAQAAVRVR
jgi:hypothetical protein